MDHAKIKHYTSIVAILAVSVFGAWYLRAVEDPRSTVILTIIGAIAGLGGYQIRKRAHSE